MLGECVLERKRGRPQGGTYSEPATMVDLGYDCKRFVDSFHVRASVNLQYLDYDANHILVCLVHVDDALFGSYICCDNCIQKGIQELWPADVGVCLEEFGEEIHFLHTLVTISPSGDVVVQPYPSNYGFSSGNDEHPAQARICPFLGFPTHTYKHLCSYLFSHVFSFDSVSQGRISLAAFSTISLLVEFTKTDWPIPRLERHYAASPAHEALYTCLVRG